MDEIDVSEEIKDKSREHEDNWFSKIASASTKTNDIYSNYVGNKNKILSWIAKCMLKEKVLDYPNFIDLFGGSGNCSYFFNQLGKKGVINELLYYSHNMHNCMFSDYNKAIIPLSDDELIPQDVKFIEYENISLFDTGSKKAKSMVSKNDMFANDADVISSHDIDVVSVGVKFESNNPIFNNFWKVVKPFIGRNLTGKEGFEICCYLTRAVMNGDDQRQRNFKRNDKKYVIPIRKDSIGFIKERIYDEFIDSKNSFIYIDPPYGGDNSNSKYYKIYDLMECISYASYIISDMLFNLKFIHGNENEAYKSFPDIASLSHDINELKHIQDYGSRFSGSKQFNKSFFELLEELRNTDIPVWIFSFGGDSSFSSTSEITRILQNYCHHVSVYSVDYNYSYRRKSDSVRSMGGMTIGVDTDDEAGKRENTDTEVLFICKR